MRRDFAFTVLVIGVLVLLFIMFAQHAPQPKLPVVKAASPKVKMLFAPCPLDRRNLPKLERTA